MGIQSDILNKDIQAKIDHWINKFPEGKQQSAVIAALHIVQDHHGYLTNELMEAVAQYLEMPKVAVYEVATFYSMYNLKPVGKHHINVCTSVSCMLRGVEDLASHLKARLKINFGETTADGCFTLKEVECLCACGGAPVIQIDKTYHENLTPEKIDALLDAIKENADVA